MIDLGMTQGKKLHSQQKIASHFFIVFVGEEREREREKKDWGIISIYLIEQVTYCINQP